MTSAEAVTVLHRLRTVVGRPADAASDAQLLARFVSQRDHAAFAGLVARHGPMVLGVCRSVLRNWHDAEDAFQATFLVLARKADTIRTGESVAGWLYGVGYHAAVRAQADAARRRARERKAAAMPSTDPILDMTLREVQQVLHEELHRLPEKYRAPLVLCYLEGKSQEEAARQLGWSKGVTRGLLDRGRERLRQRLARRGAVLSVVLGAASLGTVRAVPPALAASVVRGSALPASGGAAAGAVSANASALAEGVMHAMFAGKVKTTATVALLAVALLAAGAGTLLHDGLAAREPAPMLQTDASPAAKEGDNGSVTISGRVLGPDGKPFAGAKVHFVRPRANRPDEPHPVRATTDEDGRFRFRVAKAVGANEEPSRSFGGTVIAVAAGHGPGWSIISNSEAPPEVTLKLVKDDVPIQGRVVDLEGKPIKGVSVRVTGVTPMAGDDLKPWLDAAEQKKDAEVLARFLGPKLHAAAVGLSAPVTTDADGRFRLTGAGRGRIVTLRIEGPTIETRYLDAITRVGPAVRIPLNDDPLGLGKPSPNLDTGAYHAYHGANFLHAAAPTRPVVGTVTDKDTGRPLAGAVLRAHVFSEPFSGEPIRVTTDEEGRYRLIGLPAAGRQGLMVFPPAGQPYLGAGKEIPKGGGDSVRIDFQLKRGVAIRGRVTDQATGKAVRAEVRYNALPDNPNLKDVPGFRGSRPLTVYSGEDGSYSLVALPGSGIVTARALGAAKGQYVTGSGAEGIKGAEREYLYFTFPDRVLALEWNTLAEVNPKEGENPARCDVSLDPGKTVAGTVVGPDGKPIDGVDVDGSLGSAFRLRGLRAAEFTLTGVNPRNPRPFFFRHAQKKLGGAALVRGDEPKGFTVRLQPTATITGRVLDDGQPVAGLRVGGIVRAPGTYAERWFGHVEPTTTDEDGRFRLEGVIPGVNVSVGPALGRGDRVIVVSWLIPQATLRPGETRDFGDMTLKRPE